MSNRLKESATLTGSGSKRRIRLLSEGQGSSGFYSAALLERDGATAFPAGTQIFFDHLTESEEEQRGGSHSIKDLVGVTLNDATFDAETNALLAEAKFFPSHANFIEDAADFISLSIEASGKRSDEGIIESLLPNPYNAIAVVPRGGRDGKILELVESYREHESGKISESSNSDNAKEHKPMDENEISALAEKLAEALAPAFTALTEALTPPAPVTPVEDEKTEPTAAEVAEAVVVAFPTSEASRKRVYEALKTDPDVAKAIEDEKALVASISESLKETFEADGFTVRESKNTSDFRRTQGWNR
jgi:hypothetical protein